MLRTRITLALLVLFSGLTTSVQAQVAPTVAITDIAFAKTAAGVGLELGTAVSGHLESWSLKVSVDSRPASTRSALGSPLVSGAVVARVPGTAPIEAEQVRSVTARVELGRLPAGAYPARVELVDTSKGSATIASVDFFVPVMASMDTQATPVTWLWPIIDRPHRGVDGVFFDDLLAASVSTGGRLDRLVTYGTGESIVWVIEPEVVAAVADMSDGYRIRINGESVDQEPNDDARRWIDALKQATADREVIVLPYGDPDLDTLADLDSIRLATTRSAGARALAAILNRAPATMLTDLAWPTGGRVSKDLVAALALQGYTHLLTTSRERPAIDGSPFTPSARADQRATPEPLVADAITATWLERPDPVAATRVLAEIATIATERPRQPRHQILLPPRIWDPTPTSLRVLQANLRPQLRTWAQLLQSPIQERGDYAFSAARYSDSHVRTAQSAWRDVAAIEAVLGVPLEQPSLLANSALAGSLRMGTPSGLLTAVQNSSRALVNGVRVLPGRYTLTAKEQQIPVTVVNDFDLPARVFVVVEPHAPRIQARQTPALEVPARGRTQVLVPITSVATGLVAADARLLTASGEDYGDGQVLTFDVRSIGPVANWVLIGSTALLALAVALRLTRRIRHVQRQREVKV